MLASRIFCRPFGAGLFWGFITVGYHPRLNSDYPFGVKIAKLFPSSVGYSVLDALAPQSDIGYSLFLQFPQGKPLDPAGNAAGN